MLRIFEHDKTREAMLKRIFQSAIYPVFMLSAAILIIAGITSGLNQYLATIPVIALYGFFALILERSLPYEKKWLKGSDWNLDFTYYIVNYLIKIIAQISLIWLATLISFPQWFPTSVPFWVQVLLALLIIDFFLFFVHWQSHKYMWLWRLHAIHHSSERLYFVNGEKRHALHQILEGGPGIVVCLLIGTPQPVVVAALAILAINMMMQHTNLDYKAGVLRKIFCVAELHRWHHRADYKDAQVNYGAWLTIWDRLFNTAYDKHEMSSIGAIGIAEEKNFPKNYVSQFMYPFSKILQQKSKTLLVILLLTLSKGAFSQHASDDLIGKWSIDDGSKIISVEKAGERYIGTIAWVRDNKLQAEVGKKVMWDLRFNSKNNEWADGEIQMPDMTHPADVFIKFKSKDVITVTGYHGLRLFSQSKSFKKVTGIDQ